MLRNLLLATSIVFLTACAATKPTALTTDETAILHAEVNSAFQSLVKSANSLDVDAYFKHFDKEKFTGLNGNGVVWQDITPLAKQVRTGFDWVTTVDSLHFDPVKIVIIDRYTAILINEYRQQVTLKNAQQVTQAGAGSQVWSKRSGQWLLVSVSSSVKADAK